MKLRLCKIKSLFPIDIKFCPSFATINCKCCHPIGIVFIYESIGSLSESNVMKQLSYSSYNLFSILIFVEHSFVQIKI